MWMNTELAISHRRSMACKIIINIAHGIQYQWPLPLSLNTHYTFIWNQNQHSVQVLLVDRIFFCYSFSAAIPLSCHRRSRLRERRIDVGVFCAFDARSGCIFVPCAWRKIVGVVVFLSCCRFQLDYSNWTVCEDVFSMFDKLFFHHSRRHVLPELSVIFYVYRSGTYG